MLLLLSWLMTKLGFWLADRSSEERFAELPSCWLLTEFNEMLELRLSPSKKHPSRFDSFSL